MDLYKAAQPSRFSPLLAQQDELANFGDDDYLIFDCPGQVELYSHIPVMKNFVDFLKVAE
jgi:GTPase SAR1 family protein